MVRARGLLAYRPGEPACSAYMAFRVVAGQRTWQAAIMETAVGVQLATRKTANRNPAKYCSLILFCHEMYKNLQVHALRAPCGLPDNLQHNATLVYFSPNSN